MEAEIMLHMLHEVRQTQENKYYISSNMWNKTIMAENIREIIIREESKNKEYFPRQEGKS